MIVDIDITKLGISDKRRFEALLRKMEKEVPKIKVKLLNEECMPTKGHRWDAGWDLKTTERLTIPKGKTTKVHTGVIFEIPTRNMGIVVARSGMGTKHRVTLANDVGIIDSEYRGEILVFLTNDGDHDLVIEQYDRFAQLIIAPINTSDLWAVDQVSETNRGSGGFGSTGVTTERFDSTKENTSNVPQEECTNFGYAESLQAPDVEDGPEFDGWEERSASKGADVKLKLLEEHTPSEYIKLQKSGMMYEYYPDATGIMTEDLKLDK